MKKFYSIVLMATMLLVGTNAWAETRTASNATEFENAWKAAQNNDVIQLTDNIDLNKTFWLGTLEMNGTPKSITLDLNGHKIVTDGVTIQKLFFISHGELIVDGVGEIIQQGSSDKSAFEIFRISGSTYKGDAYDAKTASTFYSHLVIGKDVTLTAKANAVVVDQMTWPMTDAAKSVRADGVSGNLPTSLPAALNTSVYGHGQDKKGKDLENNYGLANGARIDVYGTIRAHKYAIKANGNLGSPTMRAAKNLATKPYYSNPAHTVIYTKEEADTKYTPFIYIHKTADLRTLDVNATYSIAAYSGGYARWMVEGTCIGSTGVYVKSGEIVLNDATVASNFEGTYVAADSARTSGVDAGGSGIVMESSTAYAGDIAVTVQGDTKVSGTSGYAIDESVTASNDSTKVDAITITGGTFVSGAQGTMHVTETTVEANADPTQETIITIIGGQTSGSTTPDSIGNQTLAEFLGTQTTQTHVTVVEDENGKQVVVISQGDAPAVANSVSGATESTVNWQNTGATKDTIKVDKVLDELQINQDYEQTLVINSGKKLTVGRVILGKKAQIIVEAGGTFIVTGTQGIVAPVESNIVLKSTATKYATFLFNPAVTSNRHPNATVEYTAVKSFYASATSYQWERFGIPTHNTLTSIECTTTDVWTNIQIFENDAWQDLGWLQNSTFANTARLNKPFIACNLLTERAKTDPVATYVMKGELVGNTDAALNANLEWNPFSNSYTADVDVTALLAGLASGTNVDPTVYLATPTGLGTYSWDAVDPKWVTSSDKVAPMQAFILHNHGTVSEVSTLNYKNMLWTPATSTSAGAPRRFASSNDNTARLRVIVANEQGVWDNVKMTECTVNLHNAAKYMNDDVNIYAMADEKAAIVAAENLENTYVGFSTVNGGKFTISFANVEGREFDLIDLETGARVAVAEGFEYEFTADANSANDYRFKIVERNNVPTAIENTEAAKSAKGIYTITGQYMGEMNVWNTLPAGVYVVNGEKVVK